ncbi:large ribosomal subunit protein bL35m [Planococcus citri]|uniref:large ribosomal subunit protein bL35m n=1 Tax=Planococcus citri TaxID=170843 RepID=UPI0031F9160D
MLRSCWTNATSVPKILTYSVCSSKKIPDIASSLLKNYSILSSNTKPQTNALLRTNDVNVMPVRTKMNIKDNPIEEHRVFNFDRRTGKRSSCEAATKRFMRLRWGGWIRTIGEKPSDYKKFRRHVFCNAQQSRLLDKLAGGWYMKPHYYVDDPYEPYHNREEYLYSRKKPVPARD